MLGRKLRRRVGRDSGREGGGQEASAWIKESAKEGKTRCLGIPTIQTTEVKSAVAFIYIMFTGSLLSYTSGT